MKTFVVDRSRDPFEQSAHRSDEAAFLMGSADISSLQTSLGPHVLAYKASTKTFLIAACQNDKKIFPKHKKLHFGDLADMLWLLITCRYRLYRHRWFVKVLV